MKWLLRLFHRHRWEYDDLDPAIWGYIPIVTERCDCGASRLHDVRDGYTYGYRRA